MKKPSWRVEDHDLQLGVALMARTTFSGADISGPKISVVGYPTSRP